MEGKVAGKLNKHGIRTDIDESDIFGVALAEYEKQNMFINPKTGEIHYRFDEEIHRKQVYDAPEGKKSHNKLNCSISDKEAISATLPRIEYSIQKYPDMAIGKQKVNNGSLSKGVKVIYEVDIPEEEESQTLEFDLHFMYSRFKGVGARKLFYDALTSKEMVKILQAKYGIKFAAKYAYGRLSFYHDEVVKGANIEKCAHAFQKDMSYIGMRAIKPEELICASKTSFVYERDLDKIEEEQE